MRFKKFLLEYGKSFQNQVDIVYQQILDNLDDGHIDMSEDKLLFNVGKIIKNSAFNNLHFVIQKAKENDIYLGTDEEENPTIVIDTSRKLPTRQNIDSFLEDSKFANAVKKQIRNFLELHYDGEHEVEPNTTYEKTKGINSDFETHYEKLMTAINQKIEDFGGAKSYLKKTHGTVGNIGKQQVLQSAIGQLFDSELGGTFDKFKSIVLKLPQAEFIKHLNPEGKKKFLSRLESYFEQKADKFKLDDET